MDSKIAAIVNEEQMQIITSRSHLLADDKKRALLIKFEMTTHSSSI